MKGLPKILCAIALLSISGFVWASCPDGQEENDRTGECVPIKGSAKAKKSLFSGSGWRFELSMSVGAKKHGYQVVSAPEHPVRYGKKSERFEVRPGDCSREKTSSWSDCKHDKERSELTQSWAYRYQMAREGHEYWYRWSIYIPKNHRNLAPWVSTVYGQFKQAGCPPAIQLVENTYDKFGGGLRLAIWRSITADRSNHWHRLLLSGSFVGKWNDIVLHARWTRKNDGWLKMWVNGKEKVAYSGKTMSCDEVYFKYGIYRSSVSMNPDSKTVTTIAYYDGVVRSKSKEGMFDPLSE